MQLDDPENPPIIEDFIRAIGATPVVYAMRNECCGGYVATGGQGACRRRRATCRHGQRRATCGAEMIVTACPLCLYNLDARTRPERSCRSYYFTELLAEALGVKEEGGA